MAIRCDDIFTYTAISSFNHIYCKSFSKNDSKEIHLYKIEKYIENHNYVKSIQLYDLDKKVDNNLQLKFDINRVGGVTDKAFETNCILEDGCHIPLDFYVSCKDLFDIINADQKSLLEKTMNLALLETHVRMIADKCEEITKQYFSKVKIKELTYEHYIYYRVLFILAYKGYEF